MDPRVLIFKNITLELPEAFASVEHKRMLYACGDSIRNSDRKTNIQKGTEMGYNIFCCALADPTNISYLTSNPQLNIVLCVLTGNKEIDFPILESLFANKLVEINTDDVRYYPSAKTCFTMLKRDGICKKVSIPLHVTGYIDVNGNIYPEDLQWGMPNFNLLESNNAPRYAVFKKNSEEFQPQAIFRNSKPPNTSRNETIAKKLMQIYNAQKKRNNIARKSWAEWHKNHPLKPRGGTRKKTKPKHKNGT